MESTSYRGSRRQESARLMLEARRRRATPLRELLFHAFQLANDREPSELELRRLVHRFLQVLEVAQ